MSCAHPFLLKSDKYSVYTGSYFNYVPCGWCLNCRVDKQNELTHRCEYELINYKCGAFVTLTYDDLHILPNIFENKGEIKATLSRSDLRHYMYRLRANIKNHLPDTLLSNHHFKMLCVGEYGKDGQIFDRPHFHILLFGLDFAYCKKEIEKAWQGRGMIKCLPILNGGIRYVLKYLDKQLFGEAAKNHYDDQGLERPFQVHSLGLGKGLFDSQKSYIKNHNGCYHWKGKDVPLPPYYKNKYYFQVNSAIRFNAQAQKYKTYYGKLPKNRYDLHDFNIRQSLLREKNLNVQNHLHGRPEYHFMTTNKMKVAGETYIKNLADQAILKAYQVPF